MDCILFCIFLLAFHQNSLGASSPQKAQLPTEVEAPFIAQAAGRPFGPGTPPGNKPLAPSEANWGVALKDSHSRHHFLSYGSGEHAPGLVFSIPIAP